MAGSGTGTRVPDSGPALTVDDLRNFLWDLTEDNTLLDAQEFSTDTLEMARELPVQYWNAEPPDINRSYTVDSFPSKYLYYWKIGAAAQALRMAAFKHKRNEFSYQAGGVAIQDNAGKAEAYLAMFQQLWSEWIDWCIREKRRLSDQRAFLKLN